MGLALELIKAYDDKIVAMEAKRRERIRSIKRNVFVPKKAVKVLGLFFISMFLFSGISFSAPAPEPTITPTTLDKTTLYDIAKTVYQGNELTIHGTEYAAGEKATIFLQLKDASNNPIINGSCYLTLFHPNKSKILNNAPMLYLANSAGIFFYDYNLPIDQNGVYMMSAECTYSNFIRHYYTLTSGGWNPFEGGCGSQQINATVNVGNVLQGTMIQLNNLMDWAYVYQASSGGGIKATNVTFTWNSSTTLCKINKSNTANLDFYYMGETYNSLTMYFYAWNWNNNGSWDYLGNTVTAGKATATVTSGVEDYFAGQLNVTKHTATDGTVKIMVYATSGAGFSVWYDWMGLVAATNNTAIVDLKGSGEVHISGSAATATCKVTTEDTIYEKSFYHISIGTGSIGDAISYSIHDEYGNNIFDSNSSTGSNVYVFNNYAYRDGTFTILARCGTMADVKTIVVFKTGEDTSGIGLNLDLLTKIIMFLAITAILAGISYASKNGIIGVISIVIILYTFYALFMGGLI